MEENKTLEKPGELDIYYRKGLEEPYRRALGKVCELDRSLVGSLCDFKATQGISKRRLLKTVLLLRIWRRDFLPQDKTFLELGREDVNLAVRKLNDNTRYSESTKSDLKKGLKAVIRFGTGKKEPDAINDVTCGMRAEKMPGPPNLLSESEIARLLNACTTDMDRCLIALLAESGARIGEILTLKYGDVAKDESGFGFRVNIIKSKTKKRRLLVCWSEPYIAKWISLHPTKKPDDWLFLYTYRFGKVDGKVAIAPHHKLPSYNGIRTMLIRIAHDAGVNKRIYCHLFRKSSATTKSAHGWNLQKLTAYHGWAPGSKVLSAYLFNTAADADQDIIRDAGLAQPAKPSVEFSPKTCYRCGTRNGFHSVSCEKCGTPLNSEAVERVKEQEKANIKNMIVELLREAKQQG